MNKFEQVSSLGHQMSVAGGWGQKYSWEGLYSEDSFDSCLAVYGIVTADSTVQYLL